MIGRLDKGERGTRLCDIEMWRVLAMADNSACTVAMTTLTIGYNVHRDAQNKRGNDKSRRESAEKRDL